MKVLKQVWFWIFLSLVISQVIPLNEASAISSTGNQKVLVLMVDFPDKHGQVQRTYFEDLMFGNKPTIAPLGSFADYYYEVSYGQLTITGQVNDGAVNWYLLPQNYNYYTGTGHCNGKCAYPNNVVKMVEDAIMAADATVDFGQYDTDNDGLVDAIFIVHAGCGAEFCGNGNIWSVQVTMPSLSAIPTNDVNTTGNPVSVINFTTEPEYLVSPNDMTIGVFAHEFGHLLGLPDLYDRDSTSQGLGTWSLMAGGSWNGPKERGNSPAHPDAWSKSKLGWVSPSMSTCPNISIPDVETNPITYKFVTNRPEEYFIAENRQKFGFDKYLHDEGLAIYHIDESITTQNDMEWYAGCPICTSHYLSALEQADSLWELEKNINSGDRGDLYPYRRNKAFTSTSTPNSNDYTGNKTNVSITNISASKSIMTATINVQKSKTSGIPIAVAPFNQYFGGVSSEMMALLRFMAPL